MKLLDELRLSIEACHGQNMVHLPIGLAKELEEELKRLQAENDDWRAAHRQRNMEVTM
jgi:hypothetical protein